jgi:hypothetical protein
LVASDETGVVLAAALRGCHLKTALNFPIKKERIEGFRMSMYEIPFRAKMVLSTSQLDEEVFAAVSKTKEEGRQVVALMDPIKVGINHQPMQVKS